jgi:gamma-butyrobetaine dioxygenase
MVTQALGVPAVWLRHNCPCPDCRDPVTGQRLVEITEISNGTVASVTAELADSLEVTFTPGGHRSVFSRAWLAANGNPVSQRDAHDASDPRTEDGKVAWRAADLAALPAADWASYLTDDEVREYLLDAVARYGAGLLRGVPAEDGMVTAVAETFGYVRETNYGRIFDVRVVADPANLAFTSAAIAPHTDNPYRDPVPTLQLLHCLRDADLGGDTVLVDGFAAAAGLRAADPVSFGVLAATPVPFSYVDKETSLTACQPLIALSPRGRIACVRLNNRSMQPVRLPFDQAEALYAAYRAWAEMVARPEFGLRLRLAPGDCLLFDNTRILHARTAFSSPPAPAPAPPPAPAPASAAGPGGSGSVGASDGGKSAVREGPSAERHLQGCYADLDGLLSTLAVLRRDRDH